MNSIQDVLDPLSGPMASRNRRRNPFWRFRRVLFVGVLMAAVGIGSVLYAFSKTELPEDRVAELAQTSYLCSAEVTFDCGPENATAQLSVGGEDRELIAYADLPPQLVAAVVATEDQDFFNHQGVDPRGITRAAYQYLFGSGVTQGGSTITQQYVKLAFNDEDETLTRKSREAIRAVKLEQELAEECAKKPDLGDTTPEQCAKEEILTRYLNRAYFGRGASGVQSASRSYFGKDVSEITAAESAFLAGLLRNPTGADPEVDLEEANRRRTVSLQLMLEAGYLTVEEANAANESEWDVVHRRSREGLGDVTGAEWGSEYFVEEVRQQLDELYPNGEIYTKGLRVYTTLHQDMQRMAYESAHAPKEEDLATRDFPEMGPLFLDPNNPNDPDAALVSIDREGRVVAMLGGTNFEESEFNLATSSGTAGRQPGSTFKTLGLALAVDQNISMRSFYPAVPGVTRIGPPCFNGDGTPWDVSGGASARSRHRDLVDALRASSNVVFAQLVVQITPNALADFATRMGVTSPMVPAGETNAPCSLILGSQGVPVIDMAAAYSVFERDGQRLDPVLIERVEDSTGQVICWYPVNGRCSDTEGLRVASPVISESTAHQVNYALTQVVDGGTGRRAPFSAEHAVAGKTGTSQLNRDGWFAGFTCGLTTVVWIGHAGEETEMYDFRKPLPEGATEQPRDEKGDPIDDRGWPNIEGGNFPTMIWSNYMSKVTAGMAPCPEIRTSQEFTGTRLNQDLSTTTLPPCGVELDEFGYPRGKGPDDFVRIATTTIAPFPPDGDQNGQPEGLPVQDDGDRPPAPATCVAIDEWIYQANPEARATSTTLVDTTVPGDTVPGDTVPGDTSPPDGGESTTSAVTQPVSTAPATSVPASSTSAVTQTTQQP